MERFYGAIEEISTKKLMFYSRLFLMHILRKSGTTDVEHVGNFCVETD